MWYKETWSKSKELLLSVLSVFNCFVFAFLQRLMFLSVGMIPKYSRGQGAQYRLKLSFVLQKSALIKS